MAALGAWRALRTTMTAVEDQDGGGKVVMAEPARRSNGGTVSEAERERVAAILEEHVREWEEAFREDDDELLDEIENAGLTVMLGGDTWNLWRKEDEGWRAARPTYGAHYPDAEPGFGEGDLIGTVGPASLSPQEVVRRLLTLEFDRLDGGWTS